MPITRYSQTLLLALCLSPLALSGARADGTANIRQAIQAAYNRQNAALARKDASGALAYIAPDFVGTSLKGEHFGLAERQQGMPRMLALFQSIKATTVVETISMKGRVASVQVRRTDAMSMTNPQTHKLMQGVVEQHIIDTWVKGAGGWLLERSRQLSTRRVR